MKILHIISILKIGGAQRLLSDLLPLLADGNEVAILVNNDDEKVFSDEFGKAGVKIILSRFKSWQDPRNIFEIARTARDYDIVHVHLFPLVYWAAIASLISPMKLVYTEHSTSNKRRGKWYFRPLERLVYGRYMKIISISQQTQDALKKWLKAKEQDQRFVVVNNGVNLSAFQGLKPERIYPHTLIMVSRFVESKDQKTVIRAMKRLPNDVHVIFVGDGANLEECKAFALNQKLSDRVHFVGRQVDVTAWIAKADIGVQSSKWEGFGLTAVELMASGIPVIATAVDGLKQVVEGAGLLFNPGDDSEMASEISSLLSNKKFYDEVSEKCKIRSKQYDISHTAKAYLEIYYNLIIQ